MPSVTAARTLAGVRVFLALAIVLSSSAMMAPAASAQSAAATRAMAGELKATIDTAMADPAVKDAAGRFETSLEAEMGRLDPEAPAKIARSKSLKSEVELAKEEGDRAKVNLLAQEAEQLQSYFAALRKRALASSLVVATRKKELESAVLKRAKEIDPQFEEKLKLVRKD